MALNKKYDTEDATVATHPGKYGDHPVGGAVGAAVGAATGAAAVAAAKGAALGTVIAGPPGTVAGAIAGAAVGGVIGALAGKGVAQAVNPTTEDAYWENNYKTRPYVDPTYNYDVYRPAYRYGMDAFGQYEGRSYEEIEPELSNNWDRVRGESSLSWDQARHATRDAYSRLYEREDDYE